MSEAQRLALIELLDVVRDHNRSGTDWGTSQQFGRMMTALSNADLALAEQASGKAQQAGPEAQVDPTDPGYDVEVLREHVRHLERRVHQLAAAEPSPMQAVEAALKGFSSFLHALPDESGAQVGPASVRFTGGGNMAEVLWASVADTDRWVELYLQSHRQESAALPPLPSPAKSGTMKCEDCDGRGGDGASHYQGEFQPPEQQPCDSCQGSGKWLVELYTADQMHAYYRLAATSPETPAAQQAVGSEPVAEVISPMSPESQVRFFSMQKVGTKLYAHLPSDQASEKGDVS